MPAKAFVRDFHGQPAVMSIIDGQSEIAPANRSVMVSVIGQEMRSVMSEADWEKLPVWKGPLPFGFDLDHEA